MCGIVGVRRFDGRPVNQAHLLAMRDIMHHRGPDGDGLFVEGPVGLGHRRLSIVDLSDAGRQPMTNEDGTIQLVFNGEIYNYVELRAELIQRGHTFTSHTDTEVIIHLWEEEGERCVQKLGGMFAFLLWDKRRGVLFGARDRVGIKPFLYYSDDRQFIAASEMKAILESPEVPCRVDYAGLSGFLFSGFPLGEHTTFADIKQLPPGHTVTVDERGPRIEKYWDVKYDYREDRSDHQVIAEVAELLDDAVRIHCRSDAAVGCHLSGGLDSSTVTAFAARHRPAMKTFSIRFSDGGHYDETRYAKMVAASVGAQYMEAVPRAEHFQSLLPMLVWHMEMPLPNPGGFSYYTVSRLAADYVKVTLTGHGGDEVFAGYPAQFAAAFGTPSFAAQSPGPSARPGVASDILSRLRRLPAMGFQGLFNRVRQRMSHRYTPLEKAWVRLHCKADPELNPLLSPRFVQALGGYQPVDAYLEPLRNAPTHETFDRCLYHDLRSYLPGLLYMEDRVSMAVSVESRVPLLDHRIVELMATVPVKQKVLGMKHKALLREAARPALPEEVSNREDKKGFPVPFDLWVLDDLKDFAQSLLLSPQSLDRGVFNPDRLRGWELSYKELWSAMNVELWFRIFIDRDKEWRGRAITSSVANRIPS